MIRLSEMFNVNHFIVCQVNPHVVPFLSDNPSFSYKLLSSGFFLIKSELKHRFHQLQELDVFPHFMLRLQNILSQKYTGDVTIIPKVKIEDFFSLISNPSKEKLEDSILRGEKAAWEKLGIISNHLEIELCIEGLITRLKCSQHDDMYKSLVTTYRLPQSNTRHGTSPLYPAKFTFGADDQTIVDLNRSTPNIRRKKLPLSLKMTNTITTKDSVEDDIGPSQLVVTKSSDTFESLMQ
jgi:hypothetical protein